METLRVLEGTSTIQLVCPYCNEVQIESTALHVIHVPVDFWVCEKCGRVGKGNGTEAQFRNLDKADIPDKGPIYIDKIVERKKEERDDFLDFLKDIFSKVFSEAKTNG